MMKNKKIAIIDSRLSVKCKEKLSSFGFSIIEIPENTLYDAPVSAHPDIFVFVSNNYLITRVETTEILKKHLFGVDKGIITLKKTNVLNEKVLYPNDCVLNFARVGKYLIGRKDIADSEVVRVAREENLEFIDVRQGYSKCNVCVVNDNAIITEDRGIAAACKKKNIDVLLLKTHSVKLEGYEYGFIGGSCATEYKTNGNIIYFCGCVENHPEYNSIKAFCDRHNTELFSLSDECLYDGGSIFIL